MIIGFSDGRRIVVFTESLAQASRDLPRPLGEKQYFPIIWETLFVAGRYTKY